MLAFRVASTWIGAAITIWVLEADIMVQFLLLIVTVGLVPEGLLSKLIPFISKKPPCDTDEEFRVYIVGVTEIE